MATNFMRATAKSHAQNVCSLYKRACREIEATTTFAKDKAIKIRYQQVLLRARFDNNKALEPLEAKQVLEDGERELAAKSCPFPLKFPNSPGGTNFGRHPPDPDWILDTWHPLEKAQYPNYFARRDIRKREFLERMEKKMMEYDKLEGSKH